jgi:hypothetical protein
VDLYRGQSRELTWDNSVLLAAKIFEMVEVPPMRGVPVRHVRNAQMALDRIVIVNRIHRSIG